MEFSRQEYQGIFPIKRLNLYLLHCRQILYLLSRSHCIPLLQWGSHYILLQGIYPKITKTLIRKDMYPYVHHSIIYNNHDMKETKVPIIHFSSVAPSCLTLCDPMNCSMPGLPVHHQLLEYTQTHVHWVCDVIQPSYLLSSPSLPALNLLQHQDEWIKKLWYAYTMEYYIAIGNEICHLKHDGHRGYYAKWNKSDRERQILYDLTYMWNLTDITNQWI